MQRDGFISWPLYRTGVPMDKLTRLSWHFFSVAMTTSAARPRTSNDLGSCHSIEGPQFTQIEVLPTVIGFLHSSRPSRHSIGNKPLGGIMPVAARQIMPAARKKPITDTATSFHVDRADSRHVN